MVSNQDERLQQVADYIEAINQAEAERTPQELAALQRMANETLSPPPPIDRSTIEAIKSFQESYAGTQALLENARVTSSLLHSHGASLRQIREFADKAIAPATAAMRAMDSLYPSKQIEAIMRLTSGPLFQPEGDAAPVDPRHDRPHLLLHEQAVQPAPVQTGPPAVRSLEQDLPAASLGAATQPTGRLRDGARKRVRGAGQPQGVRLILRPAPVNRHWLGDNGPAAPGRRGPGKGCARGRCCRPDQPA